MRGIFTTHLAGGRKVVFGSRGDVETWKHLLLPVPCIPHKGDGYFVIDCLKFLLTENSGYSFP